MHFAVSGIDLFPAIPVAVGFVLAFFCSMGGVSGAFLLLPFQMSVLGFTSPAVTPTNHLYNIISTPSGIWRYTREHRMVLPLAAVIMAGTIPGTLIGTFVRIVWLPDPHIFKFFAGVVLFTVSALMLLDMRRKKRPACEIDDTCEENVFICRVREFSRKHIVYTFDGLVWKAPTIGIFLLCFVVGVIGGAYGIGGGAIIGPFLVAVFHLPVYTLAGATLVGNLTASASGLAFFHFLEPFFPGEAIAPDWQLGILFGLGGLFGMYCGARMQRYVPAFWIKLFLVIVLAGTALKYIL